MRSDAGGRGHGHGSRAGRRGWWLVACVMLVAAVMPLLGGERVYPQALDDPDGVPAGAVDLGDATDWNPPEHVARVVDGAG